MTRQLLLLFAFLLSLAILWHQGYISGSNFTINHNESETSRDREVVLHITQLERRHFDIYGKPSSQIFTNRAKQFSDDQEHLHLDSTLFFFGNDANSQWQGNANKAKLNIDNETSLLIDDVRFTQLQSSTVIKTDSLEINNLLKIATTNDEVKVYDDHSETTATGMHIKLQDQIIKLKNNVHTVYMPLPEHND